MSTRTDDQLQADLDALEDLQKHPGWGLVLARAQERYGAIAFAATVASLAQNDDAEAIALKVREVVGERNAALDLTKLPDREGKVLRAEQAKRRAAAQTASRKPGYLGENIEVTL
jgi:hypothetical protein